MHQWFMMHYTSADLHQQRFLALPMFMGTCFCSLTNKQLQQEQLTFARYEVQFLLLSCLLCLSQGRNYIFKLLYLSKFLCMEVQQQLTNRMFSKIVPFPQYFQLKTWSPLNLKHPGTLMAYILNKWYCN